MSKQALQCLVPILGTGYAISPEVALLNKNTFETNIYAQENHLEVLPLKAINRVAKAVKPEKPTKDFRKYARIVNEDLPASAAEEAYNQLHEQIWNQYWIRAKEILIWSKPTAQVHPRVVAGKETAQLKSTLLKDYRVTEDEKFDVNGIENPTVEVQWPTENGTISKELAELFDADQSTYVYTNSDINLKEGLRALGVGFGDCGRPFIYSNGGPLHGVFDRGSLLGRKI